MGGDYPITQGEADQEVLLHQKVIGQRGCLRDPLLKRGQVRGSGLFRQESIEENMYLLGARPFVFLDHGLGALGRAAPMDVP
jgi:hypothetical protein